MTPCEFRKKQLDNDKKKSPWVRFFLPAAGFFSALWMLIRILPKPSRAAYPCMKVAAPLASTLVAYIVGLSGSAIFFSKAKQAMRQQRVFVAALSILFVGLSVGWMVLQPAGNSSASQGEIGLFTDPLGPNQPIGTAKGIFPGRVVWAMDKDATNENCTNSSQSDAYFRSQNTDQNVVDQMLSQSLLELTGETTEAGAWDALFRYFNQNHDKGDAGYTAGENIFIKVNAVTAYNGAAPNGDMPRSTPVEFDTSPQTIMSMLRQLIYKAGVPQENIYLGDPIADLWNDLYDYFYAEFPDVKYCSKRTIPGRTKLAASKETGITYSDHGTVMTEITTHKFFTQMMDADYLINIPTTKGHRWAGVTFFAKNHFGSNTTSGSWQLHKGLMKPDSDPLRTGYRLYRVLVDLTASQYLGGKTMLYYMDALWSSSYEHQKPQKFQTAPFNNDWSSSILVSLDPVAIESVCLEILQKEFKVEEIDNDPNTPDRFLYVQFNGVDDYLHQAASSDWWPEGITYDPDDSGTPIGSQGVHEHWNNETDMQYSRDLGTGDGIELKKLFETTAVEEKHTAAGTFSLSPAYPNPFNPQTTIRFDLAENSNVILDIYNIRGQKIRSLIDSSQPQGSHTAVWDGLDEQGRAVSSGVYFYRFQIGGKSFEDLKTGEMVLIR